MHKTLFDAPKLRIVQTTLLMLWFDIYLKLKKLLKVFMWFNQKKLEKNYNVKVIFS